MNIDLTGEVALVTGASRGIGAAIADQLAALGARVVGTATTEAGAAAIDARLSASGGAGMKLDVTRVEDVASVIEATEARFGTITILVNNAGITRDQLLLRMKDEDWHAILDTNLGSVYRMAKAVLRGMMKQRRGRIINIASVAGISAMSSHSPHYSATKGAVVAFTKAVAAEVAGANIFVNAVAPGGVHTPEFEAYLQSLDEAARHRLWQMIPAGRLGTMEEYAATVVHLACDPHYLVGQIISPNGGCVI